MQRSRELAAPAHICARGIRPPRTAEMQKMQEQFSAVHPVHKKAPHCGAFHKLRRVIRRMEQAGLHHTAHTTHATHVTHVWHCRRIVFRCFSDHSFSGDQQTSDRSCIL